jgi:hypothetical protein
VPVCTGAVASGLVACVLVVCGVGEESALHIPCAGFGFDSIQTHVRHQFLMCAAQLVIGIGMLCSWV